MPTVKYVQADGHVLCVEVPIGENVMRGAVYNGIDGIVGECGGALSCATCHVYVDEAWTGRVGGPATTDEADLLQGTASPADVRSRLSCQIMIASDLDGLVVHLPQKQF